MRFIPWYVFGLLAAVGIAVTAPQQLPIVIYKLSLVTIGLVGGYWADKTLFKNLPNRLKITDQLDLNTNGGLRILARAIIVLAVILGVTRGL